MLIGIKLIKSGFDRRIYMEYRCRKCGLEFNHDEITAEDEQGRDLCPACCKPLNEKDKEN